MRRGGVLLALAVAGASALPAVAAESGPVTTITQAPADGSVATSPQFSFAADVAATFACSLDGAPESPCVSPLTVGPLLAGPHTFAVRATDSEGRTETAPPLVSWTIAQPLDPPVIALQAPVARKLPRAALRRITGAAIAPSGVRRVEVALWHGRKDTGYFPPACHFVGLGDGEADLEPCLLPPYVRARGTTSWTYSVPRRVRRALRPGRYHLVVRALNGYSQATRTEFTITLT